MDYRYKQWTRYYGRRLASAIMVCAGFVIWALARFVHEHQSILGAIGGIILVILGLVIGFAAQSDDPFSHEAKYPKKRSGKRRRNRQASQEG